MRINYRSIADLSNDVKKWIRKLPRDLDLIVGIPRSGMLVALLLSLFMNLPVTDVEGFLEGKIMKAGRRLEKKWAEINQKRRLKVLVVDDSVLDGFEMNRVKNTIYGAQLQHEVYYGAVYVTPEGANYVDFFYEVVETPRIFEWNIWHHSILEDSCVDLDGVLCRDPLPEEDDNGERYLKFIKNAEPLIIPSVTIGCIVTCRLEKYRKETEEWLKKHGIHYRKLIMLDLPSSDIRRALGIHSKFKAAIYKTENAKLFIESSRSQALEIARLTGKPVYCAETNEMINPDAIRHLRESTIREMKVILNRPDKFLKHAMIAFRRRILLLKYKLLGKL